jgi:hypothetical protein
VFSLSLLQQANDSAANRLGFWRLSLVVQRVKPQGGLLAHLTIAPRRSYSMLCVIEF